MPIDLVSKTDYSNPVSGFTKLFESIIHSTVWETEMHVKITWITMLAMANRNGDVCASVPGLAKAAGVALEQVIDALALLSSPDKWSRTKAHEGRRIEEIEGGWHLLNYTKYREQRDADERRIQTREAVARHRRKSADVSTVSQGKPRKAQAEAEAEAYSEDTAKGAVSVCAERQKSGRPLVGSPLEHRSHGWCNQRGLCLPASLYAELLGRLGGPEREKDLIAWLGATIDALDATVPGETVWVFWRSRFEVWQGSTAPQKGRKSAKQPTYDSDWFAECQRLHANECDGQMKHAIRMQVEADA